MAIEKRYLDALASAQRNLKQARDQYDLICRFALHDREQVANKTPVDTEKFDELFDFAADLEDIIHHLDLAIDDTTMTLEREEEEE